MALTFAVKEARSPASLKFPSSLSPFQSYRNPAIHRQSRDPSSATSHLYRAGVEHDADHGAQALRGQVVLELCADDTGVACEDDLSAFVNLFAQSSFATMILPSLEAISSSRIAGVWAQNVP